MRATISLTAATAVLLAGAGGIHPAIEPKPGPEFKRTKRTVRNVSPALTYTPKVPATDLDFARLKAAELKRARKAKR